MSGAIAPIDFSRIVNEQVNTNKILAGIQQQLASGITQQSAPPSYAVASLPPTAAAGANAWASNGRKPGEGVGGGTGCPCFYNPATSSWFSYLSGTAVAA